MQELGYLATALQRTFRSLHATHAKLALLFLRSTAIWATLRGLKDPVSTAGRADRSSDIDYCSGRMQLGNLLLRL